MKRWYAIGPVAMVDDPVEGRCQCAPDGCVGWIDTRPIGSVASGFFAFDAKPTHLKETHSIIGDGTRLKEYYPSLAERSAWASAYAVPVNSASDTLLQMLVSLLTEQADPDGAERCRPLTVDHRGNYEIHLGGHSRIYRAKFAGERDRLWPNLQRLWQSELRKTHAAEAKRGADADVQTGKMLAELARLHRCPAGLLTPKELKGLKPRKPTTTLRDDFNRPDGELSAAGNATWEGVDQGWGWVKVSNLTANFAITGSRVGFSAPNRWCLYAHDIPLSSPNTTTNIWNYAVVGSVGARQSVATPGSGALCYVSRVYRVGLNIYLVMDTSDTKLTTNVAIPSGSGFQNHIICDGSSITAMYALGDMYSKTVTNTVLASGQYTGIAGRDDMIMDNFVTKDLLAASIPPFLLNMRAV